MVPGAIIAIGSEDTAKRSGFSPLVGLASGLSNAIRTLAAGVVPMSDTHEHEHASELEVDDDVWPGLVLARLASLVDLEPDQKPRHDRDDKCSDLAERTPLCCVPVHWIHVLKVVMVSGRLHL